MFSDIYQHDRRAMLKGCYVTPGIAGDFDRSIQRLLKDSASAVQVDEDVSRTNANPKSFVAEIEAQERLSSIEYPVLVVGHVGAGKTTFLHRSLSRLRGDIDQRDDPKAFCAIVDLEGLGQGGVFEAAQEQCRVAREILEKLKTATTTVLRKHRKLSEGDLHHADPFSPETLKTLLRGTLDGERRLGAKLWERDPGAWEKKEYEILSSFRDSPLELLPRYLRQLRSRFKRQDGRPYPVVIVIDNLDQATDDYQRLVYGLALRLARQTEAVLVLCLREDTYARGREPSGFLSSSHIPYVFHVAAPALDHLLRRRVEFAKTGSLPKRIRSERNAVDSACALINTSLLARDSESVQVVAGLAGNNMREALGMVRAFLEGATSTAATPDASASFLMDSLLDVLGHSGLRNRCHISNCFDAQPAEVPFHALSTRLLAYYVWAYELGNERTLNEDIEVAVGRFAAWGYPTSQVREALSKQIREGVLRSTPPPSATAHPRRLSITASGYVHLTKLLQLPAYRVAMALTTPWYDEDAADAFIRTATASGGRSGASVADIVESNAIAIFDAYLSQGLNREDSVLVSGERDERWKTDVLGRSSHFVPHPVEPAPVATPALIEPHREEESDQLELLTDVPRTDVRTLAPLHRDQKYRGTVWIPRILWGLEWARRNGRGRLSATDIARVLCEEGDLDVPPNNVARAFRDHKHDPTVEGLWQGSGKRYDITDTGALTLDAILADEFTD